MSSSSEEEFHSVKKRKTVKPECTPPDQENRFKEHKDGSIVRIKLINFVTYDKVECHPGPNLNMIIGPNGTGKSTIVCGIALGLAGKPDVLGRAKRLTDFIKNGETVATIEIELKKSDGNLVITRVIDRKSSDKGTSTWYQNGKKVSEEHIRQTIVQLNAQVDNLCSFLPQDKVCEFAQMNPQQLLKETERAIGEETLINQHEELIKLKRREMESANMLLEDSKKLELASAKLAKLETEVSRHQERTRLMQQARLVEGIIPFKEFDQAKNAYAECKQKRDEKGEELQQANSGLGPIVERIDQAKEDKSEIESKIVEIKQRVNKYTEKMSEACDRDGELEDKATAIRESTLGFERRKAEAESKVRTLQATSDDYKKQARILQQSLFDNGLIDENGKIIENPVFQGELARITEQENEISSQIVQIKSQQRRIESEKADLNNKGNDLRNRKGQIEQNIRKLSDLNSQKLQIVQKMNPDAYFAYEWLQRHKNEFQKPVYGPVCLEINPKHPSAANVIESHINQSHLNVFITLCKADYDKFNHELLEVQHKRIDCVMFSHKRLSDFTSPLSSDEMSEIGFSCNLIDGIEGPEPVLSALCQLSNIHQTPVSFGQIDLERAELNPKVHTFMDAKNRYQISRRYGKTTVRTQSLRTARLLTLSVDQQQQQALEDELDQVISKLKEHEIKTRAISQEEKELGQMQNRIYLEWEEVKKERSSLFGKKTEYGNILRKIDMNKNSLDGATRSMNEMLKENSDNQRRLEKVISDRVLNAQQIDKFQVKALEALRERSRLGLKVLQMDIELICLNKEKRRLESQTEELQMEHERLKQETKDLQTKAKAAQSRLDSTLAQYSDEEKIEMRDSYADKTLEELNSSLIKLKAKVDACPEINQQTLQDYETRKNEVATLTESSSIISIRIEELKSRIDQLKSSWLPRLNELIKGISSTFGQAFTKMGCAGQVQLLMDEDFSKWGVEILVKFRDQEKLQPLTGHRQSGGERSVSTILYLMSLQTLSRTPFRVVDEINQGMDPRNERMVHGQLVDVACQPNTSQYFLITPKLLADLKYHERMKVLCIFNGPYQPGTLSIKSFV